MKAFIKEYAGDVYTYDLTTENDYGNGCEIEIDEDRLAQIQATQKQYYADQEWLEKLHEESREAWWQEWRKSKGL